MIDPILIFSNLSEKFLNFCTFFYLIYFFLLVFLLNNQEFLESNYDSLVRDYGGKIILIRNNTVVFADSLTRTVLAFAKSKFPDKDWIITKIDSGEAALYGF